MNIIAAEFNDLISGRTPNFEKTTANYPKIEIRGYDWKNPFKEGVTKDVLDEITLRASTIFNEVTHYEQYTIVVDVNNTPADVVIEQITKKLIEGVECRLTNVYKTYNTKTNEQISEKLPK